MLPGLFLTEPVRELISWLERAPVMRDVFPSGHAAVAAVVQWYSFQYVPLLGRWLLPLTASLLLSTVYLGYHYAVDVVAGLLLAVAGLLLAGLLDPNASELAADRSAGRAIQPCRAGGETCDSDAE